MSEKTTQKRPVRGSAVVGIVIWSLVFCLLGLILLGSVTGIHTEIDVMGLPGVHLNLGGFTYEDADEYTVGDASISDTVSDLEINWLEGSIAIIPSDTDEIRITEEYGGDDSDLRLRWRVKNGKLTIQFRKSTFFGTSSSVRKDLTVAIPAVMLEAMGEVEITTVSGGISFTGNADELTLDAVNGDLTVSGDIGELEIHAVEGTVTFTGGVRDADVSCVAATAVMRLDMATDLSFDQVDGDVELYLSEEITGFSVKMDSLKTEINAEDFEDMHYLDDGSAKWGDGSLRISMDGLKSKLNIKKLTND
jgi:DUF4097 and DUF4098 domain-containing protein YvlB